MSAQHSHQRSAGLRHGTPERTALPYRKSVLPFLVLCWILGICPVLLAATPPNILLIIADDYGADSSSLYNSTTNGASLPPTPNISALAQSGVVFRNAYANPICSPTRACLLTGRHGFRTGIGDVIAGMGGTVLTAPEFTLPEAFAANPSLGYQLAHFGKWHLNNGVNSPNNIGGWPHYAGSLIGAVANYTNWTKTVNGVSTANYTNYATTDLVNDAITWIQARGTQPWFAWIAFNAPHSPFHKPPANLAPHYAGLSGTQPSINANPRPYYEAATEAMDTELGRLLAVVDRSRTHIIFLGDNGTPTQVLQPPLPAGRGKDTLYEGGVRVPFLVAGPSVTNPGRTNETLVHAVDVYSTVLELAGINVATTVPASIKLDSQSLLPMVSGTSNPARLAYSEKFGTQTASPDGRMLRGDGYKLIRFATAAAEFYDLNADPVEQTNLLLAALTPVQQQQYDRLIYRLAGFSTSAPPVILSQTWNGAEFSLTVAQSAGVTYALWRCADPVTGFWSPVNDTRVDVLNSYVILTDPAPLPSRAFYSVIKSP